MKLRTLITLGIIAIIATGCFKTKTCNLSITNEEKTWFPYDSTDKKHFMNDQGDVITLDFSKIYTHSDDEVPEESRCEAKAAIYINLTDSSGNRGTYGHYLLLKTDNGDSTSLYGNISFGQLDFYQEHYLNNSLRLSHNGNLLQKLDTLTVHDSTFQDVWTIAPADTALYLFSEFQNIYFTKHFEVLKLDREDGDEFGLIPPF